MQLLKFNIIALAFSSAFAFNATECFDSSYEVEVTHKSFPFGLLTKTLGISKKGCEVTLSHNQWKYLNRKWVVDICRDPIHIKSADNSVEVFRKVGSCKTVKNPFCNQLTKLKKVIEDDGLIFAEGSKSELDSDHGKVYCSYILMQEYLSKSVVFNKGENYDYLLKKGSAVPEGTDSQFTVDPSSGKAIF